MIFSFFHYITWAIVNIIGKLFLNLKVHGQENLKDLKSGGVLFVANHHSKFDPFLIGASVPFFYFKRIKCFRYFTYYKYITRKWYGFVICLIGAYSVYPSGGDLKKSLKKTIKILQDNQSVLIFPAGKRDKYFDPKQSRPGVGCLAKILNPLIVPVYVKNTYNIKLKDLIFRIRKVSITFGKPFYYQEATFRKNSFGEIAIKIMERVRGLKIVNDPEI